MKLLIVCVMAVSAFAAGVYEGEFSVGMKSAVFQETKLRSAPKNDAANVLRALTPGMRLTVNEKADPSWSSAGVAAPWYKVAVIDGGKEAVGYVWGGHIALAVLERGTDLFVIGLTRYAKGEFDAEVRLVRGGSIIKRIAFRPHYSESGDPGSYYYSLSASMSGNRGVDGIDNVIDVNCWFPSKDYPYGHIWIAVSKDALYPIARESNFEESESKRIVKRYVFPADPSGERGVIAMIDVNSVFDGKTGDFAVKSSNRTLFRWQNNALVPAKK